MNETLTSNAVALFVRQPVPGRVKTRLAQAIGEINACTLYEAMVADVLVSIKTSGLPLFLFHDGLRPEGLPEMWINAAHGVYGQEGSTLDERMRSAFERLYFSGIDKVILAGSDIPGLCAQILQSASDALDQCDVVLAPACDGGYCLVGFRKDSYTSRIFCNIPWSTDQVLSATIDRCNECQIEVELLETLQDIDTIQDLKSYHRNSSLTAINTNNWILTNGFVIPENS